MFCSNRDIQHWLVLFTLPILFFWGWKFSFALKMHFNPYSAEYVSASRHTTARYVLYDMQALCWIVLEKYWFLVIKFGFCIICQVVNISTCNLYKVKFGHSSLFSPVIYLRFTCNLPVFSPGSLIIDQNQSNLFLGPLNEQIMAWLCFLAL
jgi:hypothetical protein